MQIKKSKQTHTQNTTEANLKKKSKDANIQNTMKEGRKPHTHTNEAKKKSKDTCKQNTINGREEGRDVAGSKHSLPSVGVPDVDHGVRAFLPCHQPAFVITDAGARDGVQL